jgi:RepB DNA-primase from phage plasmid
VTTAALPDTTAALQLWEHLFSDVSGYLCAFSGSRVGGRLSGVRERFFTWPHAKLNAADWLAAEAHGHRETYFAAHLFTEHRRVKQCAAPVGALWVDGDGALVPPELPQPTAVVLSSPGRHHFYWRLTRPIAAERAEELNRRLAYAMGADKSGWDLTQLLRPPGMPNFKYEGVTVRLAVLP